MSEKGFDITYLPVNSDGLIDLKKLEDSMNENTLLVSIMGVHNEIGVIQPLKKIREIWRKKEENKRKQKTKNENICVKKLNIPIKTTYGI